MRKNLLATLTAVIFSLTLFAFSVNNYAADEVIEELKTYVGEMKIIPTNQPHRIAIGNPEIADVTSVSTREIALSPKAAGSTTLVFWDSAGEHSYRIRVYTENIQDIKNRVDKILSSINVGSVYTQAVQEENKVILLGSVKTTQDRARLNLALDSLKDKIVDLLEIKEDERIIEIDVQLVELNRDATKTLGFLPYSTNASPLLTLTEGAPTEVFVLEKFTRNNFIWKLDALAEEGKARILSRPRLACQSGKEAELMVGGEKPNFSTYATTDSASGSQIEYKEYGIKLKIKPTVTEEMRIKLTLNMEVSEIEAVESLADKAKAYPLKKRNMSTELIVDDGQTLAIGGLVKEKAEEDLAKTSWLGDIPVIGLFFKKKVSKTGGGTGERGDVELFIALTPTIIGNVSKKAGVRQVKKETGLSRKTTAVPSRQAQEGLASDAVMVYSRTIQKRILENLDYPAAAKEAGYQGTVKLGLHFSHTGELLDVNVKESSGHKTLDEHAAYAAKSISSYPPFPSSIEQQELWIDIPIIYSLD